ncbi:hypothetical protein [Coleofasciculus sp. E2-BRE-01]|uniref:hypothetical protein n=1 Tax=Coleofasciculus sp. E2-BRE-01 TaxID=3069524 RepID=UPI0032FF7329
MSNPNDPNPFFDDDEVNKDKLFIEVPPDQTPPYQERIPSGYDPMGEIYLRGRAFRSLSAGTISWWILISGWFIFGVPALLILINAIILQSFMLVIPLGLASIPLLILWRGTAAKLSTTKRKRR